MQLIKLLFSGYLWDFCSTFTDITEAQKWIFWACFNELRTSQEKSNYVTKATHVAAFAACMTLADVHDQATNIKLQQMLRSESPSGKCAKLHTVATSNNRDHTPWSLFAYAIVTLNRSQVSTGRDSTPQALCYCLFAPQYGCYSSCTSRSWWIAHSTQRQRRGCNTNNVAWS